MRTCVKPKHDADLRPNTRITAGCRRFEGHFIPHGTVIILTVRWPFARMSGLTYTAIREPERQASCVAPWRDQDAALLGCCTARGRLPAAAAPEGRDALDAAFTADADDRPRCHELRINDADGTWRVIYRIDRDAIVIAEVFAKKTQKTPDEVVRNSQQKTQGIDDASRQAKESGSQGLEGRRRKGLPRAH